MVVTDAVVVGTHESRARDAQQPTPCLSRVRGLRGSALSDGGLGVGHRQVINFTGRHEGAIRVHFRHRIQTVPTTAMMTSRQRNEARCGDILEASVPLALDDLPWGEPASVVLDSAVIDALVYMRDVEGFTDRDLVGFTAHRTTLADPLISRFLDVWRVEEAGHAQAIDVFLRWYGARCSVEIPPRQLPPPASAPIYERALAYVGGPVGSVVTAAHMTWGAANELLTLNGYRLLAARCGHPLLAELLRRIAAQESRHFSFYVLQAEWRLASSRLARATLRRVLTKAWTPVGVGDGYKSPDEFGRLLAFLARGEDGRRTIARMDRRFAGLPGLQGLTIYQSAAETVAAAAKANQ